MLPHRYRLKGLWCSSTSLIPRHLFLILTLKSGVPGDEETTLVLNSLAAINIDMNGKVYGTLASIVQIDNE